MKNFILILCFTSMLPLQAQRNDFDAIDFWRADYIANQHAGEALYNLPRLVHGLTAPLNTDVERFRAIYYWICHNIRGEYYMMHKNTGKRKQFKDDPEELSKWNDAFKKEVFAKLLQDKETLCTGYAYLVKEMSNLAGLECEIIYGYGPTNKVTFEDLDAPNHSWNAVKLDGKWYLSDATWSSGIIDMASFMFEFRYDDSFFLMEPVEFVKKHKPVAERWTLLQQQADLVTN